MHSQQNLLIILDDREFTSGEVRSIVGLRRYGDIIFKRNPLYQHFHDALPEWARRRFFHVRNNDDVANIRALLEVSDGDNTFFIVAARAGIPFYIHLRQLIERLPFAEENFTDRFYDPLMVFIRSTHHLIARWEEFSSLPVHLWNQAWSDCPRLKSLEPLDLASIQDFLSFTCESTATRYFNEVRIDDFFFTKRSVNKSKLFAEYSFFKFIPEVLQPWLVQPFDYKDEVDSASYKMLRYYLADAALQWIHGAFDEKSFSSFIERLLFFISERPSRLCDKSQSLKISRDLFLTKVIDRVDQFLASEEGKKINLLAKSTSSTLEVSFLLETYISLYKKYEKHFIFNSETVGHGDPCFSNILYDQQRYILKLIDPKGVLIPEEIWTHPLYDLCKISHSVLGDYDFINNGLYSIVFNNDNTLALKIQHSRHEPLKIIFKEKLKANGYDSRVIRIGEASLFLSMIPLHIDHPNKILAFLINAKHIMDQIENGNGF